MRIKAIIVTILLFVFSYGSARVRFDFRPDFLAKPAAMFKADTVTICIMGDMMMHKEQIDNAYRGVHGYDFTSYFKNLQNRIAGADLAIANMEFTLGGCPFTGYPTFSAPDSFAVYLAACGFDIFLAANNHIFDKASKGAARTIEKYRELVKTYGIRYCGLACDQEDRDRTYPLIVHHKGISIAIINFTYGTNLGADQHWPKVNYMNNRAGLKAALERADECDFTLVLPHWGNEYELTHSPQQREMAQWLIENGADMIIGTHPHVVQDSETINGVQVAYSLGNAVSNMSAANTQVGLMAEVRLVRETNGDITVLPIEFKWLWCSRPGGFDKSYTVLPVNEYLGSREKWIGPWEYDKMIKNYERVNAIWQKKQSDSKQSIL